jgi:hypothetical protein
MAFSSRRHVPSQQAEEELDDRALDERLARLRLALIVFGKLPIASQPREAALHNPSARLNAEPAHAWGPLSYLQIPATV